MHAIFARVVSRSSLNLQAAARKRMGTRYSKLTPIGVTYKVVRRVAISVIGITLLIIGTVMIVAPGPALIVIPVGLAILGVEYAWARNLLKRLRKKISDTGKSRRAARTALQQNRVARF